MSEPWGTDPWSVRKYTHPSGQESWGVQRYDGDAYHWVARIHPDCCGGDPEAIAMLICAAREQHEALEAALGDDAVDKEGRTRPRVLAAMRRALSAARGES